MTKYRKKLGIIGILFIVTLLIIGQGVYANNKEPGSKEDPIVTLSYIEQRIEQLKFYIDEKISSSQSNQPAKPQQPTESNGETSKENTLELVYLKTGERFIGDTGAEIILRMGTATAITSYRGGLSDVTEGRDIQANESIPANHLLIVPRDDGRGVVAKTDDVILMVRGNYIVER